MTLEHVGLLAGTVATGVFVVSYLPMLVKAARSKDLSSYSGSSLLLANAGNLVQAVYVGTLPPGPLWFLHGFYLVSSALMLLLWWRHAPSGSTGDLVETGVGRHSPPRPAGRQDLRRAET